MNEQKVLNADELKSYYDEFCNQKLDVSFDEKVVPDDLRQLIPYAQFWGHTDDGLRLDLGLKAPDKVKDNLANAIKKFDGELDDWLAGPEALKSEHI